MKIVFVDGQLLFEQAQDYCQYFFTSMPFHVCYFSLARLYTKFSGPSIFFSLLIQSSPPPHNGCCIMV